MGAQVFKKALPNLELVGAVPIILLHIAGWSSLAARRAHNPEVAGSNPAPATTEHEERRLEEPPLFVFGGRFFMVQRLTPLRRAGAGFEPATDIHGPGADAPERMVRIHPRYHRTRCEVARRAASLRVRW